MPRMVHRRTGSVVVVSDEKATSVALKDLGFEPESGEKAPAKKATAKRSSSKSSSK